MKKYILYKKAYLFSFFSLFITFSSLKAQDTERSDYLKIGSALRFNTAIENYERSNKDLDAYFKMDTWLLSADEIGRAHV